MKLDCSLNYEDYSWSNALLWGSCAKHFKKALEGSLGDRVVHFLIFAAELAPIISQIVSIFEMALISRYGAPPANTTSLIPISISASSTSTPNPLTSSPPPQRAILIQQPPSHCSRQNIIQYHRHIASLSVATSSLMTWSRWSDANIMPSMEGLAQIGQSLIQKHGFPPESLSVCPTLKKFVEELEKIQKQIDSENVFQRAFIIPTRSTTWGKNRQGLTLPRSETFAQHIVSVALEKRRNEFHIVLLDPMVCHGNEVVHPERIGLEPELENTPFTESELVLSYITSARLNPKTTVLYRSTVSREQSNGCWAFALKDAIAFLKSPKFFTEIELKASASVTIKGFQLKSIDTLPIRFILTAQWNNLKFEEYLVSQPEQDTAANRKKFKKYLIEDQNQRIGHAMLKWLHLLQSIHGV